VIVDLARIANAIHHSTATPATSAVLRLVFASAIRGSSNADPVPVSGLERTKHMLARDEVGRLVNPFAVFRRKLKRALVDVAEYQRVRREGAVCRAAWADATEPLPLRENETVQAALTSPPYHGAVDYYRRHQLEMFWLGFTVSQQDRLELLDRYLGRPHVPARHRYVAAADLSGWPTVAGRERDIRVESPQRANEFTHYCVGMARSFARLSAVLQEDTPAIFVVGHSKWNGEHSLDTSELLAEVAAPAFELDEQLWYPVKNRHMSYGRRNGANIDREYVLVFRRTDAPGATPS
jgi:hypothetical protein